MTQNFEFCTLGFKRKLKKKLPRQKDILFKILQEDRGFQIQVGFFLPPERRS